MDIDDIQTVGVMGAGTMGHAIAELAVLAGYDVRLRDINEELVQKGYEQIEWSLEKLAENEFIQAEQAESALDQITPVVDVDEAVEDVDFVIEAVPERMDIKRDLYEEIDDHAPEDAILATNTSSLSITELSEATDRASQFCGMHFFNPPVRMDLVEVIRGDHTAEETIEVAEALAQNFGKTPVRVRKDSPGFIVNRILIPMLNEAAWLLETDVADMNAVDATATNVMELPMGAFELTDTIGVDVTVDILEYLEEMLGSAYRPCPLLLEKVEAEELGRKTDRGFYDYDDGGVEIPTGVENESIADRLRAVMANEVGKLVGGDVADPPAIDQAMQLGAGFPKGPAEMADEMGLRNVVDILSGLHEETGEERYNPEETLVELADTGDGLYE